MSRSSFSKIAYRKIRGGLEVRGKCGTHANLAYFNRRVEQNIYQQPVQKPVYRASYQHLQFSDDFPFITTHEIRWDIFNFLLAGGLAITIAKELARRR